MFSKIYNSWQLLKGNLWFVPAVFCIVAVLSTFAFYALDIIYFKDIDLPQYIFQGSTDDAKSVVITLLSAMITMATLAISITIVVLSLAASQLGPRIIKTFMSDRRTKDFIGLFFATVVMCFVLTGILHARGSEIATPQLTISFVFLFCFINLFVLLGFVHHVAHSCIADNVIFNVANDLKNALQRLTTDSAEHNIDKKPENPNWPKDFKRVSKHMFFKRSGYIQNINYEGIVNIANEHELRIQIEHKAGKFVVKGEDGISVYTKSKKDEEFEDIKASIENCFIIGDVRTPTQDIEYSIRHLVEIAIRALSPGINDSFTAMSVLDSLSEALAVLFVKDTPPESFYNEEGVKRLIAKQSNDASVIFTAFDQIRHNSATMPSMIRHLLEIFIVLEQLTEDKNSKIALLKQVKGIKHSLDHNVLYVSDIKELKSRTNALIKKLS